MGGIGTVDRGSAAISAQAVRGNDTSGQRSAQRDLQIAVGYKAIQQAGQRNGDSQADIERAQSQFAERLGIPARDIPSVREAMREVGREYNLSPREQAEAERDVDRAIDQMVSRMAEGEEGRAARSGAKGGGGGSWLMRLAEKLGEKLDIMADEMDDMANRITDDTPSLTAKFGAKSQEFGIMMNATTNAIKTIGEAQANSARKG